MESFGALIVILIAWLIEAVFAYWYIIVAAAIGYFIATVIDARDFPRRRAAIEDAVARAFNSGRAVEARDLRERDDARRQRIYAYVSSKISERNALFGVGREDNFYPGHEINGRITCEHDFLKAQFTAEAILRESDVKVDMGLIEITRRRHGYSKAA